MSSESLLVENMIFKGLMLYEDYARKIMPFLEKKYFTNSSSQKLFQIYQEYFTKYNNVPTIEILAVELNNTKSVSEDELVGISDTLSYIVENKDEFIDEDWLFQKTEEHAKSVLLDRAILKTIRLNEDETAKNKENEILTLYEEISSLSFDSSIGTALFDDIEKRYSAYTEPEDILPFKMNIFNDLFGGGARKKTLACLVGRTNIGKSLHLCHHAADFVRNGYNVIYFSGEMSEKMTYERIDSNLTGIHIDDFRDQKLDKEKYIRVLTELKKTNGNLVVKEFPTSSCHVGHMKNVIRELRQKKKFKADVVIIDYLNLFLSQKGNKGDNLYSSVKSVSEEIRGMCVEENVFGLTATQLNRSGSKNQESADETSVSDSYGVAMTMDIMIGIFDTPELIEQNLQGLSLWKTRFSNKTQMKSAFVTVDWSHMRLSEESELSQTINRTDTTKELVHKTMMGESKKTSGAADIRWN